MIQHSCGHILKGGTSGGKTVKERGNGKKGGKGKRGWGYVIALQVKSQINKINISNFFSLYSFTFMINDSFILPCRLTKINSKNLMIITLNPFFSKRCPILNKDFVKFVFVKLTSNYHSCLFWFLASMSPK